MQSRLYERISLLKHWFEVHQDLDYVSRQRLGDIWREYKRVVRMYETDGRHYHTIKHILATLRFVDDHARNNEASRYKALVKMALIYHDCIYEVGNKNNEEASAVAFIHYATIMNFPSWLIQQVNDLIILTKSHKLPPGSPVSHQLMNDADMSIFLAEPDTYLEYARNIWLEYCGAGRHLYTEKRLDFLTGLDPQTIFYGITSAKTIQRAQENIDREIAVLKTHPASPSVIFDEPVK